ncbi:MAG: hypothetical protein Q4Q03_00640 [Bowdeniella nasicola]|nr:hypothetical protein [Bowdeniella nasicola]
MGRSAYRSHHDSTSDRYARQLPMPPVIPGHWQPARFAVMGDNGAMRCFLPLRVVDLGDDAPAAFCAGSPAFGDTPDLAAALPECDGEERAYSALLSAGDYAALAASAAYPRRVVLAVDAPVTAEDDPALPALCRLDTAVKWSDVAAIFLDEAAAGPAVMAARTSDSALAQLEAWDLLWYHPDERALLIAEFNLGERRS